MAMYRRTRLAGTVSSPSNALSRRAVGLRQIVGQFDELSSTIFLPQSSLSNADDVRQGRGIPQCVMAHEWTHYFQFLATSAGAYPAQPCRTKDIVQHKRSRAGGERCFPL